jgi:hypothetical protein
MEDPPSALPLLAVRRCRRFTDAYLANPHEEYEHVGVDEEDQFSIGSAASDSDDEIGEKDIPNNEYVEDSSDDEEWVTDVCRIEASM